MSLRCRCQHTTVILPLDSVERRLTDIQCKLDEMESLIMVTRDELKAKVDELAKDQGRVLALIEAMKVTIAELQAAVEGGDLTEIAAKVDELDAALEAVSPEPAPEPEPEPLPEPTPEPEPLPEPSPEPLPEPLPEEPTV